MDEIQTTNHNGHTIIILPDDDMEDPRNWSSMKMVTSKNNHYIRSDFEFDEKTDLNDIANPDENWQIPAFAYIHGKVALSTGKFSCPWDSGQIGFVIAPKSVYPDEQKAVEGAKTFLSSLAAYINGEGVGYVIEKDGEEIDSCFGFYSVDDAISSAKQNIGD